MPITLSPAKLTMMSPSRVPALLAGLSGSKLVAITPDEADNFCSYRAPAENQSSNEGVAARRPLSVPETETGNAPYPQIRPGED